MTETNKVELIEVPTTIKVSPNFLASIIVTAIEGGFGNSWFGKQRLRHPDFTNWWDPMKDKAPSPDTGHQRDTVVAKYGDDSFDDIPHSFMARNVSLGGTMTYYETYERPSVAYTLTREKLIKGLSTVLTKYSHLAPLMDTDEDGGQEYDLDAIGADAVIQLALLDEIRYG